jgi:hypothetical protein
MNITEYAAKLADLAKLYPKAKLCYAADDEGNDYKLVIFEPTLGNFEERDFISESGFEDFKKDTGRKLKVNAICIN